jgi:predicted O-methyltransferase YrrM
MRRHGRVVTAHQDLEIWSSAQSCEFRVAGAVHAWWHRQRLLSGLAWDNLAAACLLRPGGPPGSVLMLGLAGGTTLRVLRHLLPGAELTGVEIDAEMVELARRHMDLDGLGGHWIVDDGYAWAGRTRARFDVVIDDCYLTGQDDVFRPQTRVGWAVDLLAARLNPGGMLLTNLVTGEGHRRMQTRTRAAFKRRFASVRSVTTPDSMNETLVGGDAVRPGGVLDGWTGSFAAAADRACWRRIRVRRLQ